MLHRLFATLVLATFILAAGTGRAQVLGPQDPPNAPSLDDSAARRDKLREFGFDPDSVLTLLPALQRESSWFRMAALGELLVLTWPPEGRTLGAADHEAAVAALEDFLKRETVAAIRYDAIEVLARVAPAGDTWRAAAREMLSDTDAGWQLNAAVLLIKRGDPSGWPVIRSALTDSDSGRSALARGISHKFVGLVLPDGTGQAQPIDVFGALLGTLRAIPASAAPEPGRIQARTPEQDEESVLTALGRSAAPTDRDRLAALAPELEAPANRARLAAMLERMDKGLPAVADPVDPASPLPPIRGTLEEVR